VCADDEDRGRLVPDSDVDDPPPTRPSVAARSSGAPAAAMLPLDLYTLSHLLATPTPAPRGRSLTGAALAYLTLGVVLVLLAVFGLAYVVLGARLTTPAAWSWVWTALVVFVAHAAIFDPLRIALVASYWTVFRHQLMP